MKKETLKEAGYKYLYYFDGLDYLYNQGAGVVEVFAKSKNFAGWGLKYKNTDLEFCSSWTDAHLQQFIKGLQSIYHWGEQHPGFKRAYRQLRILKPELWMKR